VPYKRYQVSAIESVLTGTAQIAPLDETTRQRWRRWYQILRDHLLGVAASFRRHLQETARTLLASPNPSPITTLSLDGLNLTELVRLTVNTGNWITTRSAMVARVRTL